MKKSIGLIYLLFIISIVGCEGFTSSDLAPYKNRNGKYGYRDRVTAKKVIPPQFDDAYPFVSGLAKVAIGKNSEARYGMIDTCGNFVVPPIYRSIRFPYDSFLQVQDEKTWILDLKGNSAVPLLYEWAENRYKSFAVVGINQVGCYRLSSNQLNPETESGLVIPVLYDWIEILNDSLARVGLNGKRGCYHLGGSGKKLVDCQYDELTVCSNGFIKVKKGEKYGYYNSHGKMITPLKYDRGYDFSCGYAEVNINGKSGFIDTTGHEKIPLQNWSVREFVDSMAVVQWESDGLTGILNIEGKIVYSDKYRWLGSPMPSSGLVAFCGEEGWGFINKEGKVVIPFMYNDLPWFGFKGNYAMVSDKAYSYALINKQNETIYPYSTEYDFSVISDSLICVFDIKAGLSKLVNSKKEEIIPFKYSLISEFNDDFFLTAQGNIIGMSDNYERHQAQFLYGLTDRQGREVLPPIYGEIKDFHEGMAEVRDSSGLTGFIDSTGKIVIPCKYNGYDVEIWSEFRKGFVRITNKKESKDGYMDKKGNEYWIEDYE